MNRLPVIPYPRDRYCKIMDISVISYVNDVLLNNYLYPICKKVNINEYNITDQIYIKNSISICNSFSDWFNDNDFEPILIFPIVIGVVGFIFILGRIIYWCVIVHMDYKKKLAIRNNTNNTNGSSYV